VIFVRPQAAGNIGALCRVMSNFGLTELRLTHKSEWLDARPDDPFKKMDWALAKRGEPILKSSTWFADLPAALHDIHLAIGSSGRDLEFERGYARPHVAPPEAFAAVDSWAAKARSEGTQFKWAFILGPEDDGLSDHEAALCQKLMHIPTADMNPSINIAMAAGCVFYHWHLVNLGLAPVGAGPDTGAFLSPERKDHIRASERGRADWAEQHHKEDFLDYLMDTVSQTQFLKYPDRESVAARVRRWLQTAPVPLGELLFAFEIVYHLRAWGTGRFESRNFLKKR
jgi:tRNA C32,U32 (ribose-2'-O)-methylase TrmJ